jgi:hypothetical protein
MVKAPMPAAIKLTIEQYLQEGLLAMTPVYDNGDRAEVLTKAARHKDPRTLTWLLRKIAAYYKLDLMALRRYYREYLELNHHISLPVTENLVLLPLKVRQAAAPGEVTIGFVSMQEIDAVLPPEEGTPYLSGIRFKNGALIGICNNAGTVKQRINEGKEVHLDFLKRSRQTICFTGASREKVREAVVNTLPNCDCFLRELFLERCGID